MKKIILISLCFIGCSQEPKTTFNSNMSEHPSNAQLYKQPKECTADINEYGFSSTCNCPTKYSYNSKSGQCVEKPNAKPLVCTPDVNKFGHPSACECPNLYGYYPKTGECSMKRFEKPLECTPDINQYGNPSSCNCKSGTKNYLPRYGVCLAG